MKRMISLALVLLLAGCSPASGPPEGAAAPTQPELESALSPLPQLEAASSDRPPDPEPDIRQQTIDALLSTMSSEEKVGQLFFARCPAKNGAALAAEYHLGGYLLFGRDFKDAAGKWLTEEQLTQTIRSYQDAAAVPLLIGVDEEGGTVVRASRNPNLFEEPFKSPQWLDKHPSTEYDIFASDAWEKNSALLRLGINVNLAPVCDVSTDPGSFIYDRTLGRDAAAAAEYVTSVVTAMKECGIGSVLKHFPGYGDNRDTHTGAALDQRPLESFWEQDFLPFQAGIQVGGGTTAVLVSHNTVAAIDPDRPASLSPAVYQILREELDFDGPALTDDLAMEAAVLASGKQCPAVLALSAGCDMVITTDFQRQIPQTVAALEKGTLTEERVNEAAARVLGWKYDLGLL